MSKHKVSNHIFNIQSNDLPTQRKLHTIDASFQMFSHSVCCFQAYANGSLDPVMGYGFAKSSIIEGWTVFSNIRALGQSATEIHSIWPSLKIFRDALAHLDERNNGQMLVNRQRTPLSEETRRFAGGLATSNNGKDWNVTGSTIFNFGFDGIGAVTPLGMVDDYILTSTSADIEEVQINEELITAFETDILNLS